MATIVDCPSCTRKLRVPDDLLGTRVKCPTCGGTFTAAASEATEVSPSLSDAVQPGLAAPPSLPPQTPPDPDSRAGMERQDEMDERPWEAPAGIRRDWEPHRGTLVMTLGIVSVCVAGCGMLAVIGLPMAIAAWVMGRRDLKKMEANIMDPRGEGFTRAGWILGIVGTIIDTLYGLVCLGYIAFVSLMVTGMSRMAPAPTPPPPTTVKTAPMTPMKTKEVPEVKKAPDAKPKAETKQGEKK